mmetsp:Transcript_54377/g.60781  ORF Transcript_54377/g.60781 Transcript_54377/m.60781 type:complete len:95 (+) Transcript_54377:795-1079(+)
MLAISTLRLCISVLSTKTYHTSMQPTVLASKIHHTYLQHCVVERKLQFIFFVLSLLRLVGVMTGYSFQLSIIMAFQEYVACKSQIVSYKKYVVY